MRGWCENASSQSASVRPNHSLRAANSSLASLPNGRRCIMRSTQRVEPQARNRILRASSGDAVLIACELAMDPQPADATVRKDVEPNVGHRADIPQLPAGKIVTFVRR